MSQIKKIIALTFFLLILLTACVDQYEVELSEVSFDHTDGTDIIKFVATNPTNISLYCELQIVIPEQEPLQESFEIEPFASVNKTTIAQIPFGETKILLQTKCRPN
ncbi:MAG: hypothetical protein ABIC91_01545 [Nanoarchaeota archaeon]|nr:hypothetical protein [Nanoarchaeota archaeon]MBU1031096.1 hypothetical protein [Nanoarchaeota archaeon]MBU1849538.1 hypothetical protein [Nanoarchaeota archaeon]